MRSSILVPAALFVAAAISGPLLADPAAAPPGAPHMEVDHMGMHEPPLMRALRQVGLSDDQQKTVHGFMDANRVQMHSQQDALQAARVAFDSAQPGTTEFQTTAAVLADASANSARSMVQSMADVRSKVDAILTPAQRTQLAKLMVQYASEKPPMPSSPPPVS